MSDAIIRINNTKYSELDFDVNIQGISVDKPENAAQVRFVITNVHGGDLSFACSKRADNAYKWEVKIPPLPMLNAEQNAHAFRVEVIIDGYYFEPACGNLILLKNPDVHISSNTEKPKVTATINTAEEEPRKGEEGEEEKVEERAAQAAGSQDGGQSAPTTTLLKPESNPAKSSEEPYNPFKELQNAQPVVDVEDEKEDDPEKIASKIIKETIGVKSKPTSKGKLFKRTKEGNPVVEGLKDPRTEAQAKANAEKVKNILNQS